MGKTSIEWTDKSWNPIRGCSRVSAGCVHCYAEMIAARFSGPGQPYEGLARMTSKGPRWTGRLRLVEEHLGDPAKWRKPCRIFVNSMSDLFHEKAPDDWIHRIFEMMMRTPKHTFQVLTKRPERMCRFLRSWPIWQREFSTGFEPHVGNIHLGTSIEDASCLHRADELRETPAVIRFLSLEPLLGPLDDLDLRDIHWVIVGGENGPRPLDLDWVRTIRDICRAKGKPLFVKQLGSVWAKKNGGTRKGGDPAAWPADLRIREFPPMHNPGTGVLAMLGIPKG